MSNILTNNFLLNNPMAVKLYHEYAKDLPIIDFHNHLPPENIARNAHFDTVTDAWLDGDHYKWRLMRANGIDEHYITGNADPKEKFMAWAATVPNTLGNPLFHWTHMELKKYFGIDEYLNSDTAEQIWSQANSRIKDGQLSVRNILKNEKVEYIGTTDDPADSLEFHEALQAEQPGFKVSPSFRPDQAIHIAQPGFKSWTEKLANVSGISLQTFRSFLAVLSQRIDTFDRLGCRASDHGLSRIFYEEATEAEAAVVYEKRMNDQPLTQKEADQFSTYTFQYLAGLYKEKGWAMQIHIGAMRNNNTKMLELIGRDTGFDSPDDRPFANKLASLLDRIEQYSGLPKTILFCLNPKDYYTLATLAGNYQDGTMPGKIQFGTAWWFNDHIDGMENQMKILANVGLIKHFIGMLTDSRSFLSFSRHEYFRRIVCNLFGQWAAEGKVPQDAEWLGTYIKGISYYNARSYFRLEED